MRYCDYVFFFKQKSSYDMRISNWSSDVCSSDLMMGGNVRVGLEDSLMIGRGQLAKSNAEQVRKIRTILTELGIPIATADEAREMLALKGGDQRSDERRVGKESDGEGRSRGTQY